MGSDVWIDDHAVVHGSTLGSGVRVERAGIVLSHSTIGSGSIVAAGSLVPEGSEFPDNSYLEGTPVKRLRDTTPEERAATLRMVAEALAS